MGLVEIISLGISNVIMIIVSKSRLHVKNQCMSCNYNEHNIDFTRCTQPLPIEFGLKRILNRILFLPDVHSEFYLSSPSATTQPRPSSWRGRPGTSSCPKTSCNFNELLWEADTLAPGILLSKTEEWQVTIL